MDKFYDGSTLIAIRIRTFGRGINPITESIEPLQVLGARYPKEAEVLAHRYAPRRRITNQLQKCLVVRNGHVQAKLYGMKDNPLKTTTLKTGDVFILLRGGYQLKFLEDTDMIEIKNGPHYDDKIFL
ncbi:MAG: hypothetical protein AAB527_01345 [Patescibacteria group bacterium]